MPSYIRKGTWRSLIRLLLSSEAEVRSVLTEVLASDAVPRKAQSNKAVQIAAILRALDDQVKPEAKRVVQISYDKAQRAVLKEPKIRAIDPSNGFGRLHQEAVNMLADNLVETLGEASSTLGRRTNDSIRRHGLRTALEQAHSGTPRGLQTAALKRRLEKDGMTAFVDRRGHQWKLSTYAEMAVRTTTSEAQNQAVINVALSRGLDLVEVDKHEHEADACSPYDGKIFSLTGRTPGYPVLDRIPPFHPQCEHFLSIPPIAFEMRALYPPPKP